MLELLIQLHVVLSKLFVMIFYTGQLELHMQGQEKSILEECEVANDIDIDDGANGKIPTMKLSLLVILDIEKLLILHVASLTCFQNSYICR